MLPPSIDVGDHQPMHRNEVAIPRPYGLLGMAIPAGTVENAGDLRRHACQNLDSLGFVDSWVLAINTGELYQSQSRERQGTEDGKPAFGSSKRCNHSSLSQDAAPMSLVNHT